MTKIKGETPMYNNKNERGQALILLAISLVVLLGFTALAIDGSMLYSERRQLQNAADASALAGAGIAGNYLADPENEIRSGNWVCGSGSEMAFAEGLAKETARELAIEKYNIFLTKSDAECENCVWTNCVGHKDDNGPKYIDVFVKISDETQTSLAHFVYQGEARNIVKAVTRVTPRTAVGAGNSLIALKEDCQARPGIEFGGTGSDSIVLLENGGAYSHACMDFNGQPIVTATDGGALIYRVDTNYNPDQNVDVNPPPVPGSYNNMNPDIPPPDCDGPGYGDKIDPGENLIPGRYDSIKVTTGNKLTLDPGLYCIENGIEILGGDVEGYGVTIYLINKGLKINGGLIKLSAPTYPNCNLGGCPPAVPGLLIYHTAGETIAIEGNGGSTYTGTIYAPYSEVSIGGTSGTYGDEITAGVQVIGDSIKIHGNATVSIPYDEDFLWHTPVRLNLQD